MSDHQPRSGSLAVRWTACLLLLVFVIYPLSCGPALVVVEMIDGDESFTELDKLYYSAYEPLIRLSARSAPARVCLVRYLELWGTMPFWLAFLIVATPP